MTIEDLASLVQSTKWFSKLGERIDPASLDITFEQLPNMEAWSQVTGMLANEPVPEIIERGMEWLPTQRDMDDPIHGKLLEERCEQLGKKDEHSRRSLDIYKKALISLRSFEGHPALKVGPHNFTEAARGAALFACRRAAYEVLLGHCNFWCSAMSVYADGHWPCGILPGGVVVVL